MEVEGGALRWTAYDLTDQAIDAFELGAPEGVRAAPPEALLALWLVILAVPARRCVTMGPPAGGSGSAARDCNRPTR